MKKKQLLLIAFIISANLFTQHTEAKAWRVNNLSNFNGTTLFGENLGGTVNNPVFPQLGDAVYSNLVSAGTIDTIYLEGSSLVYITASINKPVVVIGEGYFLNENTHVSYARLESKITEIDFRLGSEGSQLIGLHITGENGIGIFSEYISIKSCEIDYSITVDYHLGFITIDQNYFSNVANDSTSAIIDEGAGFPAPVDFNNNISRKILSVAANQPFELFNNNVFDCPAIAGSSLIFGGAEFFCQNNILKTVNAKAMAFAQLDYNISSSGQLGTGKHNIVIPDVSSIFVDSATNTSDGRYQITPGSVASKSGSDGNDRGAFGDSVSARYQLSGLAAIPVIYDVKTSGATATDLPVSISARVISDLNSDTLAQNVASAEYFFKTDLGFGNCTPVTFSNPSPDETFTFNIPLISIPPDADTLFVRVQDNVEHRWSFTQIVSIPAGGVLPLSLVGFTAAKNNNAVLLNWQTANEVNTSHFNIQRSTDGTNFTTVGKVNTLASNSLQKNYSYADDVSTLEAGKVYYRLQMVDVDGKFSYSKVVSVTISNVVRITLYPNPAYGYFIIDNYGKLDTKTASISVKDILGRVLINQQFTDATAQKVNIASLSKGVYTVSIVSEGNVQTQKLVVK